MSYNLGQRDTYQIKWILIFSKSIHIKFIHRENDPIRSTKLNVSERYNPQKKGKQIKTPNS
jgi:hypothetical protein